MQQREIREFGRTRASTSLDSPLPARATQQRTLEYVADITVWPRRSDRVLSTARATYLWLPQGTRLWVRQSDYELLDPAQLRGEFMTLG